MQRHFRHLTGVLGLRGRRKGLRRWLPWKEQQGRFGSLFKQHFRISLLKTNTQKRTACSFSKPTSPKRTWERGRE
jgi:hypothetical protein